MTEPLHRVHDRQAGGGLSDLDTRWHDEPGWTPVDLEEERRYRDQLIEEIRPLVDACRRLRDRGLLD